MSKVSIRTDSWPLMYAAPISDSAAEPITLDMMREMEWMGPLRRRRVVGGLYISGCMSPSKYCPPARLWDWVCRGRRRRCVCGGPYHWRYTRLWCWGAWRSSLVTIGCRRRFSPCILLVVQRWSQGRRAWWGRPQFNSTGAFPQFSVLG